MTKTNTQALEALIKPFEDYHGDLPEYDHPLRCVYESGIQYAVELLAKELGVQDYCPCDGTEEFDGDLGGTMINIVCAALPKDADGDHMHPRDVAAALSPTAKTEPNDEDEAYEIGKRDGYEKAVQDIDLATGGDGEFYGSTCGQGVDVPVMKARIIERCTAKTEPSAAGLEAIMLELAYCRHAALPVSETAKRIAALSAPTRERELLRDCRAWILDETEDRSWQAEKQLVARIDNLLNEGSGQ